VTPCLCTGNLFAKCVGHSTLEIFQVYENFYGNFILQFIRLVFKAGILKLLNFSNSDMKIGVHFTGRHKKCTMFGLFVSVKVGI